MARPAACRALAELMGQQATVCLRAATVHGGLAPVWFAEASCQLRAADARKGLGVPLEATQGEADRRGSEKTALQFMLRWCAPLVFVWGSRWPAGALRHQPKAVGPWPHVSRKLAMAIKHTPSRAHGGITPQVCVCRHRRDSRQSVCFKLGHRWQCVGERIRWATQLAQTGLRWEGELETSADSHVNLTVCFGCVPGFTLRFRPELL